MLDIKRKKLRQGSINSNDIVRHTSVKDNSSDVESVDIDSYIQFDKRLLHLGDRLDFNLFYNYELSFMSLYLQSDTLINQEEKQRLNEIEKLYIQNKEDKKYKNFLEDSIINIVNDEDLTLDEKTDLIYESSSELTQSLLENPDSLANVEHSKKIVTPILDSIIHNPNTVTSYMKIINYDYYTHTHSLNVSIYSLLLGRELNLDKETLVTLGQAALLHDLGKSKIDYNLVNKTSKLTPEEFEQMKMHPVFGHKIAKRIGINDKNMLDGIRHHHEKLDGTGYPDKKSGDEISLFPRIIGVCDIFDALTTRRSYKEAMDTYEALLLMKKSMQSHLDLSIVNTFIKMLHR